MSSPYMLARRHLDTLIDEAKEVGHPKDLVGRALLHELVQVWLTERSWEDVASELRFTADSLEPDRDYEFMRP
jgi:hypothetical protein